MCSPPTLANVPICEAVPDFAKYKGYIIYIINIVPRPTSVYTTSAYNLYKRVKICPS